MNRISASPMVLRIVAFAIAAMMMLVIAFGSADMSEAKKKNRGKHRQDCDAAQVSTGVVNGAGFLFPFKKHHKKPIFHQYPKDPIGNNNAAVCIRQ